METKQFVRKPLPPVEAVRVTENNIEEIAAWCKGEIKTANRKTRQGKDKRFIEIDTINPVDDRQKRAHVGDWVLKSSKGFKVYPDVPFKRSFDEVASEQTPEYLSSPAENVKNPPRISVSSDQA